MVTAQMLKLLDTLGANQPRNVSMTLRHLSS